MLLDAVSAYGRARRLASRYCYGVQQHIERIRNIDAEADWGQLQNKNDWEIVTIFLMRLRRCVGYLSRFDPFRTACEKGLAEFDTVLPSLIDLRDFEEHFDDYSTNRGRNASFEWGHLETYFFGAKEFSNGVGTVSCSSAEDAARLVWGILIDLEPTAKKLGWLSWDDRFGRKAASGE